MALPKRRGRPKEVVEAVGPWRKDAADAKNLHGLRGKLETPTERRYTDASN